MNVSTDLAPAPQAAPAYTDNPKALRGIAFGLLISAMLWLLIGLVFIALT